MGKGFSLIIDAGGQSLRALIYRQADGVLCHQVYRRYSVINHGPAQSGFVPTEYCPEELAQSVRGLLSDALAFCREQNAELDEVALVVQRSSLVCIDRETGMSLSPVIGWQDTRGLAYIQQLNEPDPAQSGIKQSTGLVPNAYYGASKMRWCLDWLVQVSRAAARDTLIMTPLGGYLAAVLTGDMQNIRIEPGLASRTLLMNRNSHQWDAELAGRFGIATSMLPTIMPGNRVIDTIPGLPGLRRTMLAGDQNTVPWSQGAHPAPGRLFVNLGSGGFMLMVLPDQAGLRDAVCQSPLLSSTLYQHDGESVYAAEATINGVANALNWYRDIRGVKDLPAFAELVNEPAGDLLFLNGVGGLACPVWREDFSPVFVRADGSRVPAEDTGTATATRSIYESILFLIRLNLEVFLEVVPGVDELVVSGGIAQDQALCQALASMCGRPVCRSTEFEATGRGAWQLLRNLSGDESDEMSVSVPGADSDAVSGLAGCDVIEPASDSEWNERYALWKELLYRELVRGY